jgi:hypothetical protein
MLKNHALYSTVHTYRTNTEGGARPHAFVGSQIRKKYATGIAREKFHQIPCMKMDCEIHFYEVS